MLSVVSGQQRLGWEGPDAGSSSSSSSSSYSADESSTGMSPSFEPADGDALRTRLRQPRRDRPHSG